MILAPEEETPTTTPLEEEPEEEEEREVADSVSDSGACVVAGAPPQSRIMSGMYEAMLRITSDCCVRPIKEHDDPFFW